MAQLFIASADVGQKAVALSLLPLESCVVELFDPPPAFRIHLIARPRLYNTAWRCPLRLQRKSRACCKLGAAGGTRPRGGAGPSVHWRLAPSPAGTARAS